MGTIGSILYIYGFKTQAELVLYAEKRENR